MTEIITLPSSLDADTGSTSTLPQGGHGETVTRGFEI